MYRLCPSSRRHIASSAATCFRAASVQLHSPLCTTNSPVLCMHIASYWSPRRSARWLRRRPTGARTVGGDTACRCDACLLCSLPCNCTPRRLRHRPVLWCTCAYLAPFPCRAQRHCPFRSNRRGNRRAAPPPSNAHRLPSAVACSCPSEAARRPPPAPRQPSPPPPRGWACWGAQLQGPPLPPAHPRHQAALPCHA